MHPIFIFAPKCTHGWLSSGLYSFCYRMPKFFLKRLHTRRFGTFCSWNF